MGRVAEPDPDRGDMNGGLVHELALVVAGGDGAELPELGKAALDGVAFLVTSRIEGRRTPRAVTATGAERPPGTARDRSGVASWGGRWQAIGVRLATWNVNSVKARLPRLLEWLDEAKPDIVCLQEIKTTTALFPAAEVEELGYEVAAHGEGRWNGVALLSSVGLDDVSLGFAGEPSYE